MAAGEVYRELGEAAGPGLWARSGGNEGPWLPEVVPGDEQLVGPAADRDSLYAGIGGLAPALAELGEHRALTGTEGAPSRPDRCPAFCHGPY